MSDSLRKWIDIQNDRWTMDSSYNHKPKDPIVEMVVSKMRERSADGINKYNTTLYDSPDGFYKFLNHLQEELLDAALYIQKLKQQK